MWAENSGLSFKLADPGKKGNIHITFVDIDGPWRTIGRAWSANPPTSDLNLDVNEPWKENRNSEGSESPSTLN